VQVLEVDVRTGRHRMGTPLALVVALGVAGSAASGPGCTPWCRSNTSLGLLGAAVPACLAALNYTDVSLRSLACLWSQRRCKQANLRARWLAHVLVGLLLIFSSDTDVVWKCADVRSVCVLRSIAGLTFNA